MLNFFLLIDFLPLVIRSPLHGMEKSIYTDWDTPSLKETELSGFSDYLENDSTLLSSSHCIEHRVSNLLLDTETGETTATMTFLGIFIITGALSNPFLNAFEAATKFLKTAFTSSIYSCTQIIVHVDTSLSTTTTSWIEKIINGNYYTEDLIAHRTHLYPVALGILFDTINIQFRNLTRTYSAQ